MSMSAAPLARRISIHALLAESDPRKAVTTRGNHRYFYPRSPCGERLLRRFPNMSLRIISIHALLAESDLDALCARCPGLKFLSTLSLRRATHNLEELGYLLIISIHALLAESDFDTDGNPIPPLNFYPRSPCGERQTGADTAASNASISIHALLAESDAYLHVTPSQIVEFLSTLSLRRATCQRWQLCCADRDFYPRSPCGERLSMDALESYLINISIHALLAESDDP